MVEKNCSNILKCDYERRKVLNIDGFNIIECNQCNHRYTPPTTNLSVHVRKIYKDDYFFGGGAGYPNYFKNKDVLINHGKRYAKIIKKYRNPGHILDIGAACGFILKGFELEGWTGTGIDPNERMVKYGREQLNLNLLNTPLEKLDINNQFDLISLIQVISHFYDLDRSLEVINRQLKNEGLLLIETWDRESWLAKVLGKKWHQYSPPSVLHWFSRKTLINILGQHGFEPIKFGKPTKKISLQHGISLLKSKNPNGAFKFLLEKLEQSKISNMKIVYPPVDVFWAIFMKKH
jgi:SAM-dependent methyltransferase